RRGERGRRGKGRSLPPGARRGPPVGVLQLRLSARVEPQALRLVPMHGDLFLQVLDAGPQLVDQLLAVRTKERSVGRDSVNQVATFSETTHGFVGLTFPMCLARARRCFV